MAEKFITVTATNGQVAIISAGSVSKVLDFGTYRAIYQGDANYSVTNPLADLKAALNAS